ncbi:YrhK family protein [Actinomadura sp. 7K507]|uniref:YrhK family protein n=1 Tax=Actinomadura sp. 7K507 TaxID=2530365 RepID=UPI001043BDF7|nr:YrhK family protein [Actinomadura sp. 7K507]TDC80734.1 hypothetical protein E1285_34245 [Actinomadura sp. 7K507]
MRRSRARGFLADFPWIHLGIGIFGNLAFVVGSVLFLYADLQRAGVWLFIAGSSGMLVGSFGEVLVRVENRVRAGEPQR